MASEHSGCTGGLMDYWPLHKAAKEETYLVEPPCHPSSLPKRRTVWAMELCAPQERSLYSASSLPAWSFSRVALLTWCWRYRRTPPRWDSLLAGPKVRKLLQHLFSTVSVCPFDLMRVLLHISLICSCLLRFYRSVWCVRRLWVARVLTTTSCL